MQLGARARAMMLFSIKFSNRTAHIMQLLCKDLQDNGMEYSSPVGIILQCSLRI